MTTGEVGGITFIRYEVAEKGRFRGAPRAQARGSMVRRRSFLLSQASFGQTKLRELRANRKQTVLSLKFWRKRIQYVVIRNPRLPFHSAVALESGLVSFAITAQARSFSSVCSIRRGEGEERRSTA